MKKSLTKILQGYQNFRKKYALGDQSIMNYLSHYGQKPEVMVVACCDSRVDPALILQCDPGDLFVVRNVANIIPPYECDESHHGTSAALEFGICYLKVKHLIIMGHSQCGGILAFFNQDELHQDDFISRWTDLIHVKNHENLSVDACAKSALQSSYKNCLTFPWIKQRIENQQLQIHLWFFDISMAQIQTYDFSEQSFKEL